MDGGASFGAWLQRRRRALALTQDALAQRVGCSAATVRKIEADERRPSTHTAEAFARALDVPPAHRPAFVEVACGQAPVDRLPALPAPPQHAVRVDTPPATPEIRPQPLPHPPTPLIGRERELGELVQLIEGDACRLLTLIGPGGIGKTRLALAVAERACACFTLGAAFVPLAAVTAPDVLPAAVAGALGLDLGGQASSAAQLAERLSGHSLLIVLDNYEHLLPGGVAVIEQLIPRAVGVKFIVTSREALNLGGEWVHAVSGLGSAAPELFISVAGRSRATSPRGTDDADAIAAICRLVGQSPLAIEMAASWSSVLTVGEIQREIEGNLDFLTSIQRDVPERHRSMRAVFEGSWGLLTPGEQQAMLGLSLFHGAFSRESAQAVSGASLGVLSSLIAKSFVSRAQDGRYAVHELIRQYSQGVLNADPDAANLVRQRFREDRIRAANAWAAQLDGEARIVALREASAEQADLMAAWRQALAAGEIAGLERMAKLLHEIHQFLGTYDLSIQLFGDAVEAIGRGVGAAPPNLVGQQPGAETYALVLLALSNMLWRRAAPVDRVLERLEQCRRVLDAPGFPPRTFARVWYHEQMGSTHWRLGRHALAQEHFEQAVEHARRLGDDHALSYVLANFSNLLIATGQSDRAYACAREAAERARARRLEDREAFALGKMAQSAYELGRYDEARAVFANALAMARGIRYSLAEAIALQGLALVEREVGSLEVAESLMRQALDLNRRLGRHQVAVESLVGLATIQLASGRLDQADATLTEALAGDVADASLYDALLARGEWCRLMGDRARAYLLARVVCDSPLARQRSRRAAERSLHELTHQLDSRARGELDARAARCSTLEEAAQLARTTRAGSG